MVTEVYKLSQSFPIEERYGLRSQVRRAATSVATKIVEGSVRPSERYWVNYLETVLGSACEIRYCSKSPFELNCCAQRRSKSFAIATGS